MTNQLARAFTRRIPIPFIVWVRPSPDSGSWWLDHGLNLSRAGLCCVLPVPLRPVIGRRYALHLTLVGPRGQRQTFELTAEVRWFTITPGGTTLGLRVGEPADQRALAQALAHHLSVLALEEGEGQ
jgi:hypothetical protein